VHLATDGKGASPCEGGLGQADAASHSDTGVMDAQRHPPSERSGASTRGGAPHRRATIEEVAALAGVGRGTVSRVLNGSPNVAQATRNRVERAIAGLGYVPNLAARSLVTRRSQTVALVISESGSRVFSEPFFGALVRGMTEELVDAGMQLVLVLARNGPERRTLRTFLAGQHVDGVVFASLHINDPLPEIIAELGMPAVSVGQLSTVPDLPFVDADNAGGAYGAVRHLLASGRQRIATIAGCLDMDVAQSRLTGYRDALRDAGMVLDEDLVVSGDFTDAGGERAMRSLLQRRPDLDAVFAASDLMASGALRALAADGRRVPADIAVVGFDDSPIAAHTLPRLTSVRQPTDDMGREIVRMVLAGISSGTMPASRILPTKLVRRDSA
jgi:DNA-binding LacI/PurR family transcriptional regulator